jgi:L-2-hydroxyglutarate oxidase LhgO
MDEVQVTVIGAGVIGLAIAAELAKEFDDVVVLEKNEKFGQETSSRNSEIVHAGIYYPKGSLKARLCVEGREKLYHYCEKYSIPHARIGKLILAQTESEAEELTQLYERGRENGVAGLEVMAGDDVRKLEPHLSCRAALYSSETGIVDSHSLTKYLYHRAQSRNALFSFASEVVFLERTARGYLVGIRDQEYRFLSRVVVNAAGLFSDRIASLAGIDTEKEGCALRYSKGTYFSYSKPSPVNRLIYPTPKKDLEGLGIHATLNLAGALRFGPDTEDVESIDYTVNERKRDAFFGEASCLIPGLIPEAFAPDMAGIRPKIKGEGVKDFLIREEHAQGLEGFINLIGIESPGLTASLAIAEQVKRLVQQALN